jgi:hypothetical protein
MATMYYKYILTCIIQENKLFKKKLKPSSLSIEGMFRVSKNSYFVSI